MTQMLESEATEFFGVMYRGEHNIPDQGKLRPWGHGWAVKHPGDVATFDSDFMTRLVFLAHDRNVRASVNHEGRNLLVAVHKRNGREGDISKRHPNLEDALAAWRERHVEPS